MNIISLQSPISKDFHLLSPCIMYRGPEFTHVMWVKNVVARWLSGDVTQATLPSGV